MPEAAEASFPVVVWRVCVDVCCGIMSFINFSSKNFSVIKISPLAGTTKIRCVQNAINKRMDKRKFPDLRVFRKSQILQWFDRKEFLLLTFTSESECDIRKNSCML